MANVHATPGVATRLPLELKLIIVQELFKSRPTYRDVLSSAALVWPETLSLIRRIRFTEVSIQAAGPPPEKLLDIVREAPEIAKLVRYMEIASSVETYHTDSDGDDAVQRRMSLIYGSPAFSQLLSCLEEMEVIEMDTLNLDMMQDIRREELYKALRYHPNLRTLGLVDFRAREVSSLNTLLLSFPGLKTLTISDSRICHLELISLSHVTYNFPHTSIIDWARHSPMPTLGPFENITDLTFVSSTTSDSVLMDFIGAAKYVFPNVETFDAVHHNSEYVYQPFHRFLGAFQSSLLCLDIQRMHLDEFVYWEASDGTLVLPARLETFKIWVSMSSAGQYLRLIAWYTKALLDHACIDLGRLKTLEIHMYVPSGFTAMEEHPGRLKAWYDMDEAICLPSLGVTRITWDVSGPFMDSEGNIPFVDNTLKYAFPLTKARFPRSSVAAIKMGNNVRSWF